MGVALLICTATLNAQRSEAILTFKDGTVKKGFGKLISQDRVKFRKNKKSKAKKYPFKNLKHVKIKEYDEFHTYAYIRIQNKKKPRVLEVKLTGYLSLYELSRTYNPTILEAVLAAQAALVAVGRLLVLHLGTAIISIIFTSVKKAKKKPPIWVPTNCLAKTLKRRLPLILKTAPVW